MLAKNLGVSYLETGQLLRDEIATGSKEGEYIASFVNNGNLVPAETAIALMAKKIKESVDATGGVVIDGFPRSLEQAKGFPKDVVSTHVLFFDILNKESIKRLSARRVCPKDKNVYNLISKPAKRDEVCDECGAKLIQREDDTPSAIQQRLDVYSKETKPLLDYYKKQGILIHIDGTPSIEEVKKAVWKIFA